MFIQVDPASKHFHLTEAATKARALLDVKTLWKEVFQLIVNATNVAYRVIRQYELEATIWTLILTANNQPQKIFFEVSKAVVAVESESSICLLLTTFNFATKLTPSIFLSLLHVLYIGDRIRFLGMRRVNHSQLLHPGEEQGDGVEAGEVTAVVDS